PAFEADARERQPLHLWAAVAAKASADDRTGLVAELYLIAAERGSDGSDAERSNLIADLTELGRAVAKVKSLQEYQQLLNLPTARKYLLGTRSLSWDPFSQVNDFERSHLESMLTDNGHDLDVVSAALRDALGAPAAKQAVIRLSEKLIGVHPNASPKEL